MFDRQFTVKVRLMAVMILSVLLIAYGDNLKFFSELRAASDLLRGKMCSVGGGVAQKVDEILRILVSSNNLYRENMELRSRIALSDGERLILEECRRENDDLRELVRIPARGRDRKMVVRIIGSVGDPISGQVVVNGGADSGLQVGQVVISRDGVVGKISSVGHSTSRISLISELSHSVSVKILRNRVHALVGGDGSVGRLSLDCLPEYCHDLKIGDQLVTSGRDGIYPEGYPVAVVESVKIDDAGSILAKARPSADLRKLDYVVVLNRDRTGE